MIYYYITVDNLHCIFCAAGKQILCQSRFLICLKEQTEKGSGRMNIRETREAWEETYLSPYAALSGRTPVSYTHLDVYKRPEIKHTRLTS